MRIAVWTTGEWCDVRDADEYGRQHGLDDDYAVYSAPNTDTAERIAANVEAGRPPLAA